MPCGHGRFASLPAANRQMPTAYKFKNKTAEPTLRQKAASVMENSHDFIVYMEHKAIFAAHLVSCWEEIVLGVGDHVHTGRHE